MITAAERSNLTSSSVALHELSTEAAALVLNALVYIMDLIGEGTK